MLQYQVQATSRRRHMKVDNYQGLREELEWMWKVKLTVIGTIETETSKLGEWLDSMNDIQHLCPIERSPGNS